MPPKRRAKPKTAPSETYAARVARGLRPISVGLPEETIADLDTLAESRGESRRDVLVAAIETLKRLAATEPDPCPTLTSQARNAGIKPSTVLRRVSRGMTIEDALSLPVKATPPRPASPGPRSR